MCQVVYLDHIQTIIIFRVAREWDVFPTFGAPFLLCRRGRGPREVLIFHVDPHNQPQGWREDQVPGSTVPTVRHCPPSNVGCKTEPGNCFFLSSSLSPSRPGGRASGDKEAEGAPQVEAGKRLEELRRRRGETESEEFEKLKQKQQEAALELEELKKKREERRKVLEEEEQRRKQEEADRKAREEVRAAWPSQGKPRP